MTTQEGVSAALIVSLLFHLTVLIIGTFGLPYLSKPLDDLATPIPIEMVDIADITQTTQPAEKEIPKPPEDKKELAKPEPEKPKQAPKQVEQPKPPAAAKEELALPDKDALKPKPKPKEKPKPPEKKPVLTQDEKTSEDDPFKALLKNLQDQKPEASTETGKEPAKPQQATQAPLGAQMTMSEMDAFRRQLSQCWNVLAGARYAEDLVVDMKLYINPDRTLRQASVVDTMRYTTDPVFRAAADSAMRALRDPACTPFMLPADKFDL